MKVSFEQIRSEIRAELNVRARAGFFENPYPGYPSQRYVDTNLRSLDIPDGPWNLVNDKAVLPDPARRAQLEAAGIRFDSLGRPLHPWLEDLLANPRAGVITGPGAYWNYGPNRAADPIVISRFPKPMILMIRRGDTGTLALPGGFVEPGENPVWSSLRELKEETGLKKPWLSKPQVIYDGIVADRRVTAHAWVQTTAVLWRTMFPWSKVSGQDDAVDSAWYPLDDLPEELFGSHKLIVELTKKVVAGEVEITDEFSYAKH